MTAVQSQALFDLARQADQRLQHAATGRRVEVAAQAAEIDGEQVEGHQLGGEGLGRGDADLRTGVGVDDAVALAGDGGFDHVADRQHLAALVVGFAQGRQGVGGLAALADHQGQGPGGDQRVAVTELAGDIDLDRDAGMLLDAGTCRPAPACQEVPQATI